MSRSSGRRGLLVTAILLVIVLVALDLMRTDSLLVSAWRAVTPDSRTRMEQGIEEFRRTRGESIRP